MFAYLGDNIEPWVGRGVHQEREFGSESPYCKGARKTSPHLFVIFTHHILFVPYSISPSPPREHVSHAYVWMHILYFLSLSLPPGV